MLLVFSFSVQWFVHHCLSFFFWLLYCLSFFDLGVLLTHLISSNFSQFSAQFIYRSLFVRFVLFLMAIELSILLRFTDSDYPFGVFRRLVFCRSLFVLLSYLIGHCLSFELRILTTPLVFSTLHSIINTYAGLSHTLSSLSNKFVQNTPRQG